MCTVISQFSGIRMFPPTRTVIVIQFTTRTQKKIMINELKMNRTRTCWPSRVGHFFLHSPLLLSPNLCSQLNAHNARSNESRINLTRVQIRNYFRTMFTKKVARQRNNDRMHEARPSSSSSSTTTTTRESNSGIYRIQFLVASEFRQKKTFCGTLESENQHYLHLKNERPVRFRTSLPINTYASGFDR